MTAALSRIALSVRQPWAWSIVAGFKDIENRSTFAVQHGGMRPMKLAIHASKGMTRDEYEFAADFMASLDVVCPRPDDLVRGAIIGGVTVMDVVAKSESPWFFGPRGLLLADAFAVDPIAASGQLGYFVWGQNGEIENPSPWMKSWPATSSARRKPSPGPLFENGKATP